MATEERLNHATLAWSLAKERVEPIEFLVGGGPGGDEAADALAVVEGLPDGELHPPEQLLGQNGGHDDKLLVGRRVDIRPEAMGGKDALEPRRLVDGMLGDAEIEVVGEEHVKLHTHESPLSQERAMEFHCGEEVGRLVGMGEDNRLAAKRPHLCAPDVEDVAMAGEERQADIVARRHDAVAQASPVNIEGQMVVAANVVDGGKFPGRVERSEFCGERDVDHARPHAVGSVGIGKEVGKILFQLLGPHLALVGR